MNQIIQGDTLEVLRTMPDDYVDTIITSPPYWGLRDYGVEGQLGLEPTLDEFLSKMLKITDELQRVLKPTGVMFWNHGDCYSGGSGGDYNEGGLREGQPKVTAVNKMMPKCLAMQNYRLVLAMIDRQGWILRNTIIWHKPNSMPSSVKDRFSNSYEPVFMLTKSKRYWFDLDAVRKPHADSTKTRLNQDIQNQYADSKANNYSDNIPTTGGGQRKEIPEILKHMKENLNPLGKNPGDVWETKVPPTWGVDNNQEYHGMGKIDETGKSQSPSDLKRNIIESYKNNPKGKNPGDLWKISTQPFPEAHFATFPEKLITPMIKAACPKEICVQCGKAKTRITETNYVSAGGKGDEKYNTNNQSGGFETGSCKPQSMKHGRANAIRNTIGWTSCDCNAGFEAGIVLDPFGGSGTVGVVAKRLGRNSILIELNPEYVEMAELRIDNRLKCKEGDLREIFAIAEGEVS